MGGAITASVLDAVEKLQRRVAISFIGSIRHLQDGMARRARLTKATCIIPSGGYSIPIA
jgi:hypothetical protein